MFYPGSAVYVKEDKKIGIYLTFDEKKVLYVFLGVGKDLEESDTCLYEAKDLIPLTVPDKDSKTGQRLYKTPFQRNSFSRGFSLKDAEAMGEKFKEELRLLLKQKWVKEKYELDLRSGLVEATPIKESSNTD